MTCSAASASNARTSSRCWRSRSRSKRPRRHSSTFSTPRFTSAERKPLRSKPQNIFHWAISNLFQWSNLRAAFVGSLVDRERNEVESLYGRVSRAYHASPFSAEYADLDFVDALVDEACRRAG